MRKNRQSKILVIVSLIIAGFGIGWLLGLSVSPVVSVVLTSVTGSAAAVIATLSGLDEKSEEVSNRFPVKWSVDPLPLATLICGVLLGSIVGITARNQSWFGSEISSEVAKWTQAGFTDISTDEMVRRLYNSRYPISGTISSVVSPPAYAKDIELGSYLFSVSSTECERLSQAIAMSNKTHDDNHLIMALENSTTEQLPQLAVIITNTTTLKNVVEQVICPNGQP